MKIVNTSARKALLVSLAAALVFGVLAATAKADNCLFAGKEYSPGAERGGQVCRGDGTWGKG